MRILLADPSEKMLSVLSYALVSEPYVEVAGEVTDSESLQVAANDLLPDLVLIDWQLAGVHSIKLIASLHKVRPQLKVIVMVIRIEDGRAALEAGADAIVSKGEPAGWLLNTVRRFVTKPGTESTDKESQKDESNDQGRGQTRSDQ